MNSRDLLAKLLANENLNIVRAPVSTASMDIRSRTLTLPQWKEMTPDVEEMLIGHEVGHALFTTDEYIKENETRALHGYMNVIEDVRIEKKIKNKYPGLRASFLKGYKELNDRDFFEVQGKDLSQLLLIDRMNLYYKVGFNCGVKFTTTEMEFIRRADKCDSIDDVYLLAKELLEFTKEERKAKKQSMAEQYSDIQLSEEDVEDLEEIEYDADLFDDLEDEDSDETDEDGEPIDEEVEDEPKKKGSGSMADAKPNTDVTDEELESQTENAFRQRLSAMADIKTMVNILTPELRTRNKDVIVSYKKVLSELPVAFKEGEERMTLRYGAEWLKEYKSRNTKDLDKFKVDSSRVVNYLVKEFEMKKSATAYKRSTTAKTGELNVRKLHSYKLTDDLFKRITVVPDAKNHGMVFLLDWSGSMSGVMDDTMKQVINLAMFCQRAQIPYQVFAFTNGYADEEYPSHIEGDTYTGFVCGSFNLLELFSNRMTNTEFNTMVDLMFKKPWNTANKYSLNSTPLNEALLYMADYLGKFIKNNNVEKASFITLTDGEGHGIHSNNGISDSIYQNGQYTKVVTYLRDPVTRREYAINRDGTQQTKVFLTILKHRYNISTIGFHVIRNSRRDMETFVRYNIPTVKNGLEQLNLVENFKKQFREKDFALVFGTGRDELYLLPATKLITDEGELKVDTKMNSKQIARQFTKFLDVKKTSRLLLSRFVSLIA
jgi:hypothetical protein